MVASAKTPVSHGDKTLYPQAHLTKNDVVEYYRRIAPVLLPYLADRPLTVKHFPDGIGAPGYYRKNAPKYFPAYLKRTPVPHRDSSAPVMSMVTADEVDDLTYLANQNALEFHITSAKVGDLQRPDQLVFNLDPHDCDFFAVRTAALAIRERLQKLDIPVFVKLSGRAGLHLHIPVDPDLCYHNVRPWLKAFVHDLSADLPKLITNEHLKAKRGERVWVGVNTNAYAQTVVAPYSLRGEPGAPVAAPLEWSELQDKRIFPGDIRADNLFRRLSHRADPWHDFQQHRISAAALIQRPTNGNTL